MKTLLALLALAATASANIISGLISGDASSLNASFSFHAQPAPFAEVITGSWAGGTFEFSYTFQLGFLAYNEGFSQFRLRTTWNDGWVAPSVFRDHLLIWGSSATLRMDEGPMLPASNHGMTYILDPSYSAPVITFEDHSANGSITFDLERAPVGVPEAGSTLTLLLASSALLFRRR